MHYSDRKLHLKICPTYNIWKWNWWKLYLLQTLLNLLFKFDEWFLEKWFYFCNFAAILHCAGIKSYLCPLEMVNILSFGFLKMFREVASSKEYRYSDYQSPLNVQRNHTNNTYLAKGREIWHKIIVKVKSQVLFHVLNVSRPKLMKSYWTRQVYNGPRVVKLIAAILSVYHTLWETNWSKKYLGKFLAKNILFKKVWIKKME